MMAILVSKEIEPYVLLTMPPVNLLSSTTYKINLSSKCKFYKLHTKLHSTGSPNGHQTSHSPS